MVVVVVDYHSRWIEIMHLSSTTSAECISKLKDIFARFGIPIELVSDKAPLFSSSDCTSFTEQYGFTLVTSSPCLPNTNGEAEQAVQTAKRILIQDDPWLGPHGLQGQCDCGHGMQSCSTGDGSTYPYDPANSIIGTVT